MEKAGNVRVLEVLYNWNDVGDWRALSALVPPDDRGNTLQGDVFALETRNSIIVSDDGGLIATLGVDDLVVVQSGGATLVARKNQLDKLKPLVADLERSGFGSYL
jgi:mannose-1-phosphate guanylyltransferase